MATPTHRVPVTKALRHHDLEHRRLTFSHNYKLDVVNTVKRTAYLDSELGKMIGDAATNM